MPVPKVPDNLRSTMDKLGLGWLFRWISQDLTPWLISRFDTQGDVTILTPGKGVVMTNGSGVTRRIRLNDAGDDIMIESV